MARTASKSSSFGDDFGGGGIEADDDEAGLEVEEGQGLTMVDLSGTSTSADYPVLPRGVYDAEMISMEYGQSQRSGNNMWTTQWEVNYVDPKAKPNTPKPKLFLHLTFTDGGLPRLKRALAAMKVDDDYNQKMLREPFDPQTVADEGRLLGARARVRVDIRRYEGQNRNNIREVLPPASNTGGGSSFSQL